MTGAVEIVSAGPAPEATDDKVTRRTSQTIIAEAVQYAEEEVDLFFQLGPRDVHPWHRSVVPSHEAIKASPHYPVLLTGNPRCAGAVYNGSADMAQPLPINGKAFPFETNLFKGKLEIHVRGLPTTQESLFHGKKRYLMLAAQGKFKREVDADALCVGQEFFKGGSGPAWVGQLILTAASKVFSSSAYINTDSFPPYFMNPVLAMCQTVNVSREGEEPQDLWEAPEDARLMCPELADKNGRPVSAEKRRKWCDNLDRLQGKKFNTEHVYTFHIWQHVFDLSTYRLNLGGLMNLDLAAGLAAQPLQFSTKDVKSKEDYLFSALVWHERLLYDEDIETKSQSMFARFTAAGNTLRSLMGLSKN